MPRDADTHRHAMPLFMPLPLTLMQVDIFQADLSLLTTRAMVQAFFSAAAPFCVFCP